MLKTKNEIEKAVYEVSSITGRAGDLQYPLFDRKDFDV